MRTRLMTLIVFVLATSLRAQVPYDPVRPELAGFLAASCPGASNGEDCYYFELVDDDGSHRFSFPLLDEYRANWSPDGRSIVGSFGDDIVIISLPTGTRTNLTNNPAIDRTPAWSPDGMKIVFSSDRDGAPDLYLMNADGSGVTRVPTGLRAWGPAWSPDGHRIAFNCADSASAASDVCAINADGSGFVRLTNDPADDLDPAWSPDGSTIVFSTTRFGDSEIVTINALDGSGLLRLSPGTLAYHPDWSPDSRIAFESIDFDSGGLAPVSDLLTMNANGSNVTLITWGRRPAWRPLAGIGVNNRPVASFTYTCTVTTCSFTSTSADSDGVIAAYAWHFDGVTSTDANPTHTFAAGNQYYVWLTVMDNGGALAETYQIVDLNQPPVATFTYSCTGLTCHFDGSASYDPDGTIIDYEWTFEPYIHGKGPIVDHTYAAPGDYIVTLTVRDMWGFAGKFTSHTETIHVGNVAPVASFTYSCNLRTCTFDGSASSDSDGTIASYAWTFGDGSSGSGSTATHTYAAPGSYTATLTVTDNGGATNSQSKTVTIVNAAPTASFTYSCNNRTCTFDGSSSSDSDGTIASYAWTFGDGSSGAGSTTSHTYALGNYTVTLTVTDNDGGSNSQSKNVSIVNASPTASFSFSCNGLKCNFDGSASSDADGTIASYAWTFGDGSSGSGATPAHTYAASGNYSVTLTVTDNDGGTGAQSKTVTVVNTPPTASFSFSCVDLTCNFDGSASSDSDGTIASYGWNFGDGATGSGSTTSHTYTSSGTYTVTLTVTDNASGSGSTSHGVTVVQPEVHVGDLDGAAQRNGNAWNASVTITVHNLNHNLVAGASVTGSWSVDGSMTCTTTASGQCTVTLNAIANKNASATFTVTNVAYATSLYRSSSNHDPDGDSDGTSIIVRKP